MSELLKTPIPKPPKRKKTFFDIGGFGHRENIISNFYAYYLDQNEDHGLEDVFLQSLLDLINEKIDFSRDWKAWEIQREAVTLWGRIDLLIEEVETERKVILIENKIYHQVNNDLDGYFDEIEDVSSQNIIGILLTINPVKVENYGYINITHTAWINKIQAQIDKEHLVPEQRIIFRHFCENFKSHIQYGKEMMEQHLYYLKHRKEIFELSQLNLSFKKALLSAIENVTNEHELEKVKSNGKYYYVVELKEKKPRIHLRFEINDEPNKPPLKVDFIIQGARYSSNAYPLLRKRTAWFKKFESRQIRKSKEENHSNDYLILGTKNYPYSSFKKNSLEDFIVEVLELDWLPFEKGMVKEYEKL